MVIIISGGKGMNIAAYVEVRLTSKGITKQWLADKLEINYKTFVGKLKRNSITAEELLKISYYLDIDLNQLKREMFNDVEH
jgi:DNA-binding CsgD family transcriptional regulator